MANRYKGMREKFVQPALAETLGVLSREGPTALHNGSLTTEFVKDAQQYGKPFDAHLQCKRIF